MNDELPPRLTRAPTPYPKDFQRYERSVNNMLRKNRELKSHNVNLNVDPSVPQIKEAKVTPMRASNDTPVEAGCKEMLPGNSDGNDEELPLEDVKKLNGPPPYHIAAVYSKNAQYFNNISSEDGKVTPVDKPRHFIQDQPTNILMPQPQHPPTNLYKYDRRKAESSWVFGAHKNPRILEISLTPCCYVLGFTVTYNDMVRLNDLKYFV